MRLIYDALAKNILSEGDQEIHGGDEFTVTDTRGRELLATGVPLKLVDTDLTRDQLNDAAAAAGVDAPESLANKTAVVDAVNEKDAAPDISPVVVNAIPAGPAVTPTPKYPPNI